MIEKSHTSNFMLNDNAGKQTNVKKLELKPY